MTLTRTFTRTHNRTDFADPYKVCNACGGWVDGVLDVPDGPFLTVPCEHDKGYRDVCPSWGPVDGCSCAEILGSVDHPVRPTPPLGETRNTTDDPR
jgi:hypothetical protein